MLVVSNLLYSPFTLRKPRSSLIINGERGILRVKGRYDWWPGLIWLDAHMCLSEILNSRYVRLGDVARPDTTLHEDQR